MTRSDILQLHGGISLYNLIMRDVRARGINRKMKNMKYKNNYGDNNYTRKVIDIDPKDILSFFKRKKEEYKDAPKWNLPIWIKKLDENLKIIKKYQEEHKNEKTSNN